MMAILAVARGKSLEHGVEIGNGSGLELDRGDTSRRSGDENRGGPGAEAGFANGVGNNLRDIVCIALAARGNPMFVGADHVC